MVSWEPALGQKYLSDKAALFYPTSGQPIQMHLSV